MVFYLSKILGFSQLSLAEDIVHETLAHALVHWRAGAPENPEAWLYRVAKNKLLDHLRREALRLSALLAGHPLSEAPKTQALAALLCFQASRFDARLDARGDIIVLQDQDRSLWDQELIRQGYWYFQRSASGKDVSAYHLEAAIASYHAASPDFASTNWQAVFHLYELLCQINTSPVAAMNRAIALGYFRGPAAGIEPC